MENERETLRGRIVMALEELAGRVKDMPKEEYTAFLEEPHDVVHEIADGCVPVYNSDLLDIAAQEPSVALDEPEIGPAFDGRPTPINIIAANIFEAIEAALWRQIEQMKEDSDTEEAA